MLSKQNGIYSRRYYGPILSSALRHFGIPHLIYRPALVQHKDINSILDGEIHNNRRTLYFKDYLDNLNVSLLDSLKPENNIKLQEMLNADIEIWRKEAEQNVNRATLLV